MSSDLKARGTSAKRAAFLTTLANIPQYRPVLYCMQCWLRQRVVLEVDSRVPVMLSALCPVWRGMFTRKALMHLRVKGA